MGRKRKRPGHLPDENVMHFTFRRESGRVAVPDESGSRAFREGRIRQG
jgi:hypothetical protein